MSGNEGATRGARVVGAGYADDDPARERVNFVTDLGANPEGRSLSDGAIETLRAFDGTLTVEVPPGVYQLSDQVHRFPPARHRPGSASSLSVRTAHADEGSGLVDLELVGTTSPPIEVAGETVRRPRFVAPARYAGRWLDIAADRFLMAGIDIDRRTTECGPQVMVRPARRATIADVGVLDRDDSDAPRGALLDVRTSPGGRVVLDSVRCPHGATWSLETVTPSEDNERPGRPGIYAGPAHQGDLVVRDCIMSEQSSYGLAGASARGLIHITGGVFENSNRAQIRFGGPDDVIEGTTVRVDLSTSSRPDVGGVVPVDGVDAGGYTDCRGLRVCRDPARIRGDDRPVPGRAGRVVGAGDVAGPTVRECHIEVRGLTDRLDNRAPGGDGSRSTPSQAILDRAGGIRGSATALATDIEATHIHVDPDEVPAIQFNTPASPASLLGTPAGDTPTLDTRVRIARSRLTADARTGFALGMYGRQALVRDSCIERGPERAALDDDRAAQVSFDNSTLNRRCPRPR